MDFKQADSLGKNGNSLHKDDRRNLAKCISGFGNSEGGVVVWGVECSRNVEIGDVAKRMGRLPDEDGKDRLTVQSGSSHKIEHSSGSDIEGVTIGRDLNALMPLELAQYSDTEMESLF